MNNSKTRFQYSSAFSNTGEIIANRIGTAVAGLTKTVHVTDLKVSVGGTAGTFEIKGRGSNNQSIKHKFAANTTHDWTWNTPYRLSVVSTTGTVVGVVASATGFGARYTISGYLE